MAVSLSNATWFMNSEATWLIEGNQQYWLVSKEDRQTLTRLREEYYKLTEDSYFENDPNAVTEGPHVSIKGLTSEVQVSSNEERMYNLFEEVADVLKSNYTGADVYIRLRGVFEEMGRKPTQDTKKSIEYALGIANRKEFGELEHFRWQIKRTNSLDAISQAVN